MDLFIPIMRRLLKRDKNLTAIFSGVATIVCSAVNDFVGNDAPYGRTALIYAAKAGHLDIVKFLVENGARVNWEDERGRSALISAAMAGHLDIVKCLVENGASINWKDWFQETALEVAVEAGHVDIVKYLVENGASVNPNKLKLFIDVLEEDPLVHVIHKIVISPARTRERFLESQRQDALSRIESLEKDLSDSNKQNESLKAKCAEKDKVIKVQQEEINKLRGCCMELKKEASMKIEGNVERKMQGGETRKNIDENNSNSVEEDKSSSQVVPREMFGFDTPFNCSSSCGCCVVFFILHKMGLPYCSWQLIRNMQRRVNTEVEDCIWSLKYFVELGVLEKKEILSKEITGTYAIKRALNDAHKRIENQIRPALLALEYENKELVDHCVAIMADGFTVIDVQNKRYWTPEPNKQISHIHVVNVRENAAKEWIDKCGFGTCVGWD